MLREILNALKGGDSLSEMFSQIGCMLDAGQWMFQQASEVLMRRADWGKICDELYKKDRQINEIEQTVRERIIAHLSVGNQADLPACLVLMSVVKDAERIGDYCKNIFEVGKFYQREYTHPEFASPLEDIRSKVLPLFNDAREAFLQTDRELALGAMSAANGFTKRCDVLIQQLLSIQGQLAPDEAVAYVLLSRFYKRVAAHLANIATSVVSPVPMLDYKGKMPDD